MGYVPRTEGGYELFEVISALQKDIRRGNEKEALYWALELEGRFSKYLWRRLVAIVVEDIGMANNELVGIIVGLRREVEDLRKEGQVYSLNMLAYAVLALCRSPKTRESDEYMNEVLRDKIYGRLKLDIPDYALDQHTMRGKQMGRAGEHFWEEGAKVHPQAYRGEYVGYTPEEGDGWRDAAGKKRPPIPRFKGKKGDNNGGQSRMF